MEFYTEADRPRLLDLLKIHGPMNVPRLAEMLDINPTAVRQQLSVLQREGLVGMRVERRKIGRPTHVYSLTDKAQALFPQAYGPIALTILRQIRNIDGEAKLEKLFRQRTKDLLALYRARLNGMNADEKIQELAKIREQEGYMARADGKELTEHHCPIASVAGEFPLVCKFEKLLFEELLGTKLDRTKHIGSGDHACVYRPAKKSGKK